MVLLLALAARKLQANVWSFLSLNDCLSLFAFVLTVLLYHCPSQKKSFLL